MFIIWNNSYEEMINLSEEEQDVEKFQISGKMKSEIVVRNISKKKRYILLNTEVQL